ncbi:MAG: MotA/TolQ/ExbB proton channel family protein [Lentisphaerae bacterium]|nr:MAG: MotA/TolQ/ExbB proton channel family protein [Lentisphaerota bacterium]
MAVLIELLKNGNLITWSILIIAFIGTILVIERFFNLWRADINFESFIRGVINTLRSQNAKEAIQVCDETPGPIPHIVREVIMHARGDKDEMYQAAKNAALGELPRLERFMHPIFTIVYVAPLLGFIGAMTGFLDLFSLMNNDESNVGSAVFMSIQQMAPAIKSALCNSILGLSVAVPFYIAYNMLRQKIDNILIEMEKATVEIITYFLVIADDITPSSRNSSSRPKNSASTTAPKENPNAQT